MTESISYFVNKFCGRHVINFGIALKPCHQLQYYNTRAEYVKFLWDVVSVVVLRWAVSAAMAWIVLSYSFITP